MNNYKKLLITLFLITSFTNSAYAFDISVEFSDTVDTCKRVQINQAIEESLLFFKMRGESLSNDLNIIILTNRNEYEKVLRRFNFSNQKVLQLVERSEGAAFDNTIIIIYYDYRTFKDIQRSIAHELTHQFQLSKYGKSGIMKNMWITEGAAEYTGEYFYHGKVFPMYPQDQNIPKQEITKYQQWGAAIQKYGANRVYKQALFYYMQYLETTGKDFTI